MCTGFAFMTQGVLWIEGLQIPSSQDKKPADNRAATFSGNTIEHKTTLLSFQPLKSGMSFPNMLKFWASWFTYETFFLRQQKNCLESSNRRRENLTAGDASAICIFILAAQDFKLKTQTPPHYLFPYAKRKWKILRKEKNASRGNCPTLSSSSAQSLKGKQSPGPGAQWAGGQRYSRFSSWNACQVWRYCWHTHVMVWIKSNLHFFCKQNNKNRQLHLLISSYSMSFLKPRRQIL